MVSTGQGVLGCNMFAYCGNYPVGRIDPSGTFANWIIGGLIGGISAAINGENICAGIQQGMVSGAIAGVAVDVGIACIATGGVAGVVAAGFVAFGGGYFGNIAGEEVNSLFISFEDQNTIETGLFEILQTTTKELSFVTERNLNSKEDYNYGTEFKSIAIIPSCMDDDFWNALGW